MIFAIITIVVHIAIGLIYGFLIRFGSGPGMNFAPLVTAIAYSLLVVVGKLKFKLRLWFINILFEKTFMVRNGIYPSNYCHVY